MKLNEPLTWKQLCEETGHEDWVKLKGNDRKLALLKLQHICTIGQFHSEYGVRYKITSRRPKTQYKWETLKPGQEYGLWTLIEKSEDGREWLCECKCGKRKIVKAKNLIYGISKSCGCTRGRKKRRD